MSASLSSEYVLSAGQRGKRPSCVPKLWDEWSENRGPIFHNKPTKKDRKSSSSQDLPRTKPIATWTECEVTDKSDKVGIHVRPACVPILWNEWGDENKDGSEKLTSVTPQTAGTSEDNGNTPGIVLSAANTLDGISSLDEESQRSSDHLLKAKEAQGWTPAFKLSKQTNLIDESASADTFCADHSADKVRNRQEIADSNSVYPEENEKLAIKDISSTKQQSHTDNHALNSLSLPGGLLTSEVSSQRDNAQAECTESSCLVNTYADDTDIKDFQTGFADEAYKIIEVILLSRDTALNTASMTKPDDANTINKATTSIQQHVDSTSSCISSSVEAEYKEKMTGEERLAKHWYAINNNVPVPEELQVSEQQKKERLRKHLAEIARRAQLENLLTATKEKEMRKPDDDTETSQDTSAPSIDFGTDNDTKIEQTGALTPATSIDFGTNTDSKSEQTGALTPISRAISNLLGHLARIKRRAQRFLYHDILPECDTDTSAESKKTDIRPRLVAYSDTSDTDTSTEPKKTDIHPRLVVYSDTDSESTAVETARFKEGANVTSSYQATYKNMNDTPIHMRKVRFADPIQEEIRTARSKTGDEVPDRVNPAEHLILPESNADDNTIDGEPVPYCTYIMQKFFDSLPSMPRIPTSLTDKATKCLVEARDALKLHLRNKSFEEYTPIESYLLAFGKRYAYYILEMHQRIKETNERNGYTGKFARYTCPY